MTRSPPVGPGDHKDLGVEDSDRWPQIGLQALARPGTVPTGWCGLQQDLHLRLQLAAQPDRAAMVTVGLQACSGRRFRRVVGVFVASLFCGGAVAVHRVAMGCGTGLRSAPCPGAAGKQLQQQGNQQGPYSTAHGPMIRAMKKAPRGFAGLWGWSAGRVDYMPMPPIPPMPPMSGMAAGASALGASDTMHSVVSIRLATEAAFCSAVRVTLVGSRIPISIMSP
jgi:hypothetical protein